MQTVSCKKKSQNREVKSHSFLFSGINGLWYQPGLILWCCSAILFTNKIKFLFVFKIFYFTRVVQNLVNVLTLAMRTQKYWHDLKRLHGPEKNRVKWAYWENNGTAPKQIFTESSFYDILPLHLEHDFLAVLEWNMFWKTYFI